MTLLQILMNAWREYQVVQKHVSTLLAVTHVDAAKATIWHQMECHARVSRERTEKRTRTAVEISAFNKYPRFKTSELCRARHYKITMIITKNN